MAVKPTGLDWDALRERHQQRVAWEVERGLDPIEARAAAERARAPEEARKRARAAQRPSRAGQGPSGRRRTDPNPAARGPQRDVAKVIDAWGRLGTLRAVAKETGYHVSTVAKYLDQAGVRPIGGTKGGPPVRDVCGAGLHDMSAHGKPLKGGGRYCAECKRARGRAAWARQQEQKRRARAADQAPVRANSDDTPRRLSVAPPTTTEETTAA